MVYRYDNRREVEAGTVCHWNFVDADGKVSLPLALQIQVVTRPVRGVWLDQVGTQIPDGVELCHDPVDVSFYKDRIVWHNRGNGLAIEFEGRRYPVFEIEDVRDGFAVLYFVYLPAEFGQGILTSSPEDAQE